MEYLGWLLVGLLVGGGVTFTVSRRWMGTDGLADGHVSVSSLLRKHFRPVKPDDITIAERQFPYRVRADLQRAIDRLFRQETQVLHFCGVRSEFSHEGITLSGCIRRDGTGEVSHNDLDAALNEMLFSGGSLNLKLLGAHEPEQASEGCKRA